MARPTELKIRVPKTLDFEYEDYKEFEEFVGKDNVSRELRAMIKNFLEIQKKGEAQLDPLNQVRQQDTRISNNNNATLDIYLFQPEDLKNYMKSSVTHQFLAKNPLYRNVFKLCVGCGKYSLKPIGINQMKDVVKESKNANERKCSLCGYTHVTNLSVSTTPKAADELIHLGKEIYKIGGEIAKIKPDPDLIVRYIADLTEIVEEQNKQLDNMIKRDKKKK